MSNLKERLHEMTKEPFTIEVAGVIEHEDGGATYSFDMSDDVEKNLAEIGLKFVLYCAVAELDIQDAYELILSKAKKEDSE